MKPLNISKNQSHNDSRMQSQNLLLEELYGEPRGKQFHKASKKTGRIAIAVIMVLSLVFPLTGCTLKSIVSIQEETAPVSQENLLVSSVVTDSQGKALKKTTGERVTVMALREVATGGEPKILPNGLLETHPLGEPVTYAPGSVVVDDNGQEETYQGGELVMDIIGFPVIDPDGQPLTRAAGEVVTHGEDDIVYSSDGTVVRYDGEYETYRAGEQKYNTNGERVMNPVAIQEDADGEPLTEESGDYVLGAIEIMTDASGNPYLEESGELATKQLEPAVPEKKIPQVLEDGKYYLNSIFSAVHFLNPPYKDDKGSQKQDEIGLYTIEEDLKYFELRTDLDGYAIFVLEGPDGDALTADFSSPQDPGVVLRPAQKQPYDIFKYWDDPIYTVSDEQKWIIQEAENDSITIASCVDPQYVMTLEYSGNIDHARLVLRESDGSDQQRFHAQKGQPAIHQYLKAGDYYFRSGMTDQMMLSLGDDNYEDEREAYIYLSDRGEGQRLHISYDDNGYAIISHGKSDKVLSVCGSQAISGQPILQYEKDGEDWQKWIIEPVPDHEDSYYIRSVLDPTKVIGLEAEVAINSNTVVLSEENGSNSQFWSITPDAIPSGDEFESMEKYAQNFDSNTDYLILISNSINVVAVFERNYDQDGDDEDIVSEETDDKDDSEDGGKVKNRWNTLFYWDCVTGSWSSPTVQGEFILYDKLPFFDGNLDSPEWYTVYYANNFYPDIYIHSTIYHQGTMDVMDGTLGYNGSHGCVRLYIDNSEWIYDNVPLGTKVVSY